MTFGYARVSTDEQNLDLQLDALNKFGVDKLFKEKISGMRKDRPALDEMLKFLRSGDQVVVYKLDRISRSTKHLIELSELFDKLSVNFVSIVDKIDTSTAIGKFFFRMMASIAELEHDIICERTRAGLKAARARGRKGGRPSVSNDKINLAITMYNNKNFSIKQIVDATNISKSTLYRYLMEK